MVSSRSISHQGMLFLQREEGGYRLLPYRDQVGIWTVGVGHTGVDVHPGVRWTLPQAQQAFTADLQRHAAPLGDYPWLEQHQFDALLSFIFNVGTAGFRGSTFRRYLAPGEPLYPSFDDWCHGTAGGVRVVLPVLVGRRARERALYEHGIYA